MQTVLLTAIGSAAADAARRSYSAAGYRVIGCDIYPRTWNVTSAEVDAFIVVPPAVQAEAYAQALLDAVRTHRIDWIVPLTDVEVDVLCGRKDAFRAAGATVCCPDAPVADLCRDKLRMARELDARGLCQVIPTYTPDTLPAELPFPLMLKPLRGRSSQAQAVAHSRDELAQTLRLREDYIIQPFLTGDIFTVDCARDTQGNTVTLTRRELLRTVNGLGTTVEICPGHALDAVCRGILDYAGIVGAVNIEFIHHGDGYAFLEVNPRFSGGVGFSALAGYDFALAALRCHGGEALLRPPVFRPMTIAQRYEMRVTDQG